MTRLTAPYALVFPGQAAQYVGMGKRLYQTSPLVRETYEQAALTLSQDIKALCFDGPESLLTRTDNAQPALVTTAYAMYRHLVQEHGLEPAFLAGHSLGEITALAAAGVLEFTDALRLAAARGRFMNDEKLTGAQEGKMTAIMGPSLEEVEEACFNAASVGIVVAANHNSETQVVISGHRDAVNQVAAGFESKGAVVKEVNVSAPFHCPLMDPAARALQEEMKTYTFHPFQLPVIANVTGMPYTNHHEVPFLLERQVTATVQWHKTLSFCKRAGVDTIVEVGPNSILSKMIKRGNSGIKAYSYDTVPGRRAMGLVENSE